MVSGFFTSPYDHERMVSGDAIPILMASNSSSIPADCNGLNKSNKAFIFAPNQGDFLKLGLLEKPLLAVFYIQAA